MDTGYMEQNQSSQSGPATGPGTGTSNPEEHAESYGLLSESDGYYYGGEEASGSEYTSGVVSPTEEGKRSVQPITCAHCAARFGTLEERKEHIRN